MDRPDSFSDPGGDPYPTVPIPISGTDRYPAPTSQPPAASAPGTSPHPRPDGFGHPPATPYTPAPDTPARTVSYSLSPLDMFVTEPLPIFRPPAASYPLDEKYPAPSGALPAPREYQDYEGEWSDWVAGRTDPVAYPANAPDSPTRADATGTPPDPYPEETSPHPPEPDDTSEPVSAPTARERLRRRLETIRPTPTAPPDAPRRPDRTRWATVVLGAAGMAALTGAAYVQFVVIGFDDAPPPVPSASTATPISAATPASGDCPSERIGSTVRGNGPGGDASGPEAILAFQHGYYVARSGEQARAVVAPDAAVPSAADIQRGIDTIPAGTTHCVTITPGAFVGQYTVVITEYRAGSPPRGYNPQLVTTMQIGNRTLITAIGPMP